MLTGVSRNFGMGKVGWGWGEPWSCRMSPDWGGTPWGPPMGCTGGYWAAGLGLGCRGAVWSPPSCWLGWDRTWESSERRFGGV